MKMRKKLAALLAAAMIASIMPMTAFAASANKVTKIVTVKKDSTIKLAVVPELKIDMKDDLPTNQSFYLNLTGAEWAGIDAADTDEDLLGALRRFNAGKAVKVSDKVINFQVEDRFGMDFVFEAYKEAGSVMAIRNLGAGTVDADGTNLVPNADEAFRGIFTFPMLAKVTADDAWVEVEKYDTEISDSKHAFAVSDAARAKVTVKSTPNFYRTGEIGDIVLEELFANSIKELPNEEKWFTLELRDTDFQFATIQDTAKIVGSRAYRRGTEQKLDKNGPLDTDNYRLSADGTRLGIRLEDKLFTNSAYERGILTISGIKIVANRDARDGDVKAVFESKKLFGKETLTVATRGDYATKLAVADDWKKDVIAGTEKEVVFTLTESLANALMGARPATFTFDNGVKIATTKVTSSDDWSNTDSDDILWDEISNSARDEYDRIMKMPETTPAEVAAKNLALNQWMIRYYLPVVNTGTSRPGAVKGQISIEGNYDKDKGYDGKVEDSRIHLSKDLSSFTVDNLLTDPAKGGKYTFKVKVLVPAGVTGDVKVALTGKGVTEEEIVVLNAIAPVEVEATTMDIKVGLKEIETTGKITIKETDKERIRQGKDIAIRIADIDSGLKIKSFKAKVTEGDLVLEDRKDRDLTITTKRASTEPSTIEITDIVMSTDRTVPEGKYELVVGGNALSNLTKRIELAKEDHSDIDPVAVVKDFVNITTKNTEDISGSANKAKVDFVVGNTKYLVNGVELNMDVAPYVKDGRTMVPVRYVATALGVNAEQVVWDQANQTATIIADKTIQVKLGSKNMLVNGVSIPMAAAAELNQDRTFVPVAEIARALGVPVAWDATNGTATFN